MNDKSANFPAIYHNILKHGWNLSFTGLTWVCLLLDRFSTCSFAGLPGTTQLILLLIAIYRMHSHYSSVLQIVTFCAFFCPGFTLFCCVVIYCYLPAFHFQLLVLFFLLHFLSSLAHTITNFL